MISTVGCEDFSVVVTGASSVDDPESQPTSYAYNDTVIVALEMSYTCSVIGQDVLWKVLK